MNDISIIPYSAAYQPDFKRLNIEWIARFFAVEPHDLEQLDHPEVHILPNNGQIFLARLGDAIVGCVAMINMSSPTQGNSEFELAKMAVSPTVQGKGIGKKLCIAAIEYARQLGVETHLAGVQPHSDTCSDNVRQRWFSRSAQRANALFTRRHSDGNETMICRWGFLPHIIYFKQGASMVVQRSYPAGSMCRLSGLNKAGTGCPF